MPSVLRTLTFFLPALLTSYILDYTCISLLGLPIASASLYHPNQQPLHDDAFETWLQTEQDTATQKLLLNTFPSIYNTDSPNTTLGSIAPGTILASPSRAHPNYFFQWVRDAAICIFTYLDFYERDLAPANLRTQNLEAIFANYAALQRALQRTDNPSGSFNPGNIFNKPSGLGEPKFQVDGTAFWEPWGRPQHDGPALRALALMRYVHSYNASHPWLWGTREGDTFYGPLYRASWPPTSAIKADLEYTGRYWRENGFDLWEEVRGKHFFTAMVQRRALREGAAIARRFGDAGAAEWYDKQAERMEDELLGRFWSAERGYVVETVDAEDGAGRRSGMDCAVLLGSIHGVAPGGAASLMEPLYAPYSDEVLVSLLVFSKDQEKRFPINKIDQGDTSARADSALHGAALGRYPEDIYDGYGDAAARGGNPWFLCTSSAAEILYRAASYFTSKGNITISALGHPFYAALLQPVMEAPEPGTYGADSEVVRAIVERLREVSDEYMQVVRRHATGEGALSEQFDRETGFERGAEDLSWSYSAFLRAVGARREAFGRV